MQLRVIVHKTPAIYGLSFSLFLLGWWYASLKTIPAFVPSPSLTFQAFGELINTHVLSNAMGISFLRIGSGWLLGGLVGIPLGLLMGRVRIIREFATPYIEFFRFIPPIAFVSLFLIWFGSGETSRILLIVYSTIFIVVLNTMAGAMAVKDGVIRAARCLGTSEAQLLLRVIVPSTVPYMITGMRLAMGSSFMTIVSAEMISANSGIGYIIWSSRNYMLTDQIFVAIVVLGLMGFVADRSVNLTAKHLLRKYRYE
jgi:NitT/TauT family transport system permease protein